MIKRCLFSKQMAAMSQINDLRMRNLFSGESLYLIRNLFFSKLSSLQRLHFLFQSQASLASFKC